VEKYDGWTIKVTWHKEPWLIPTFFRSTRTETIKAFEWDWKENYKKERRKGIFKAVKVKLVEVNR